MLAPVRRTRAALNEISEDSAQNRLRAGRPTRERALVWLRDAATALDYAHEHGVVHRDVKPGYMLLDEHEHEHEHEHERVRVADFGIARVATDDTVMRTGQLLGTAAYLSPEQIEGDGHFTVTRHPEWPSEIERFLAEGDRPV